MVEFFALIGFGFLTTVACFGIVAVLFWKLGAFAAWDRMISHADARAEARSALAVLPAVAARPHAGAVSHRRASPPLTHMTDPYLAFNCWSYVRSGVVTGVSLLLFRALVGKHISYFTPAGSIPNNVIKTPSLGLLEIRL